MVLSPERREQLSREKFVVRCPSCHQLTETGYSEWDVEVIKEHPGNGIQFRCEHCEAPLNYNPSEGEFV